MDSGDWRTQTTGTYADSTARTEQANVDDWQEEVYQKIKAMKELYSPVLNEIYQKIVTLLQQQSSLPQQLRSEQLDKLKIYKTMLERILMFLQVSKSDILPGFKEKLGSYEEQIINFIHVNRPIEPAPIMQQGQLPPTLMELMQQQQQTQPQINQMQSQENQMNPRLQLMNLQGSIPAMQQNIMTNLEHNSMSSLPFASMSRPNMMGSLQPGSNLDSAQGNAPRQANMNNMQSQASWLQLQKPNSLQGHTQQMQASGSSLYPHNVIDQQTWLYRSQRNLPEASSNSIAYTGQVNRGDWQEELFQKIKAMKEMYLPELNVMYQKVCAKLQQLDSVPQLPRTSFEQHTCEKFRIVLERIIVYLQVSKSDISPGHKEKLGSYEKQIKCFVNLKGRRRE